MMTTVTLPVYNRTEDPVSLVVFWKFPTDEGVLFVVPSVLFQ